MAAANQSSHTGAVAHFAAYASIYNEGGLMRLVTSQ